jgi:hypothetical protein
MNSKISANTGFLFAQPSFGSGVARALDLYGNFDAYNTSSTEAEADECAIASDWLAVGEDLSSALEEARAK